MKKKKNTLYLLIAVIAIYAAIALRFFLLRDGGDSQISIDTTNKTFNPIAYDIQKEFKIVNDYRDPFLGKIKKEIRESKQVNNIEREPLEQILFPQVNYLGVISDAAAGAKKVLSLKIDGNEYVMREGATIDSLMIISGNQKSMIVSYKGTKKTIKLSNQ